MSKPTKKDKIDFENWVKSMYGRELGEKKVGVARILEEHQLLLEALKREHRMRHLEWDRHVEQNPGCPNCQLIRRCEGE